jgi:hypothetical protein
VLFSESNRMTAFFAAIRISAEMTPGIACMARAACRAQSAQSTPCREISITLFLPRDIVFSDRCKQCSVLYTQSSHRCPALGWCKIQDDDVFVKF